MVEKLLRQCNFCSLCRIITYFEQDLSESDDSLNIWISSLSVSSSEIFVYEVGLGFEMLAAGR